MEIVISRRWRLRRREMSIFAPAIFIQVARQKMSSRIFELIEWAEMCAARNGQWHRVIYSRAIPQIDLNAYFIGAFISHQLEHGHNAVGRKLLFPHIQSGQNINNSRIVSGVHE